MVYTLAYRRPSRNSMSSAEVQSMNGHEKQKSIDGSLSSGSSKSSRGIPDALSFDRIISGGTCPPCTVRDFMNYLMYIEHSAENLQFYLWFKDYEKRFDQLKRTEKGLSPEWTKAQAEAEATAQTSSSKPVPKVNQEVAEVFRGTDFAVEGKPKAIEDADPFATPGKTPSMEDDKRDDFSEYGSSSGDKSMQSSAFHRSVADQAFEDAGVKVKPFSMQPYRDEVARVISIYIAKGSNRGINMGDHERRSVLHALATTTHPSAFRLAVTNVEFNLRCQGHPNFIRWTICNGNRPRVIFARGLGVAGIVVGFFADLIITLSSASRPWRVLPFLGWFIGIATLIAAWKGMCVVLHGMHHRHIRPWELFSDETDEVLDEKATSTDSLLSDTSNTSYETMPWIARYKKRNIVRKVFDRQVWVTEPALRQIQDTIFVQALLGAFVISAICVGIFCAVPAGNFY